MVFQSRRRVGQAPATAAAAHRRVLTKPTAQRLPDERNRITPGLVLRYTSRLPDTDYIGAGAFRAQEWLNDSAVVEQPDGTGSRV